MAKSIMTGEPVSITPMTLVDPQPVWRVSDFNELIEAHGYEAYVDRAMRCPCCDRATGQALSTCQNCAGKGWFFVNRIETRVVSQSMGNSKRWKDSGEINNGTAKITTRGVDKLGFMDRIILLELEAYYSEIIRPVTYKNQLIAYPIYEPIDITDIFLFVADNEKLTVLTKDQYQIEGNKIIFDSNIAELVTSNDINEKNPPINVSLRYSYAPVYHVIDANRELMKVKERAQSLSDEKLTQMPIHVLCRKAHYIFDAQKFGVDLFDNTVRNE